MKNHIDLSVVIPCLNAEKFIGEQLQSLAVQKCNIPWEVIVVDNGSTDATLAIIETFQNRIKNLRIIDASEKKSPGYARNQGVFAAEGKYIAFCDADDVVEATWVKSIADSLLKYDLVASRIDVNKINDIRTAKLKDGMQYNGLIQYTYVPFLEHASSSGLAVRKEIHFAVGGFDEIMSAAEDCDYCWKIQLAGYKLQFVPEAVLHYRLRKTSKGKFIQAKTWGEGNAYLVKKYTQFGMPKPKIKVSIHLWKNLFQIGRLMKLANPIVRDRWIWDFGYRIGQLIGSIKYKTIAL